MSRPLNLRLYLSVTVGFVLGAGYTAVFSSRFHDNQYILPVFLLAGFFWAALALRLRRLWAVCAMILCASAIAIGFEMRYRQREQEDSRRVVETIRHLIATQGK